MREGKIVTLILIFLFIIGIFSFLFIFYKGDFTFSKVKISSVENKITEEMTFVPDQNYHTLYRNFVDSISINDEMTPIVMNYVNCLSGKDYIKDRFGKCFDGGLNPIICESYTENNEYGCAFGDETGFKKGQEYTIYGEYHILPPKTFIIDGKKYLKFIAYSKDEHPDLRRGKNFLLDEEIVSKNRYYSFEKVIVYVPVLNSVGIEEKLDDFVYENPPVKIYFNLIINLAPFFLFFLVWFFFGREKITRHVRKEVSFYPKERKGWEVAAYFSPPFGTIDKNFYSAILMDLYKRKIIDIKTKKKFLGQDVLIKLNKNLILPKLDHVEKQFLHILKELYNKTKDKNKEGEYFNFRKASMEFANNPWLKEEYKKLVKFVKEGKRNYLHDIGNTVAMFLGIISMYFLVLAGFVSDSPFIIPEFMLFFFILFIVSYSTTIFSKYKENYYEEYLEWVGFKRYLLGNKMIKEYPKDAVIIWGHFLVYASALGIADKVLSQLKDAKIISSQEYNSYSTVYTSSGFIFTTAGQSSGVSGAGGGAGGGGAGGGGGGGR